MRVGGGAGGAPHVVVGGVVPGRPQHVASGQMDPLDEVGVQRGRRPPQIPAQRSALSEPEREQYEQRLDAYEVQAELYRARLREAAAQLEAAHHDGLTGTWLRQAGRRLLEQELQRAARTQTPLSIAFVDVDGLKQLNDSGGHAAGDAALVAVTRTLLGTLRGYDHVVRWGGDEFLCVLPSAVRGEAVSRLLDAREALLADPAHVSISLGVVERHAGESADQLVRRADDALYRSRGRRLDD